MSRLTSIHPENATGQTEKLFDAIKHAMGKVPNAYQTIGIAPEILGQALQHNAALAKSTLNKQELEAINLVVSEVSGCDYCLAAHSLMGKMVGYSPSQIVLHPFSWTLKLESPMPRRKYSFEERLKVVMHYFASEEGYRLTSSRFNIPRTQVRIWVAAYDAYGEKGLKPRDKGVTIDPEIRIEAVKAVLSGQMSQTQAATRFNVAGAASVAKWMKVFHEHGEEGLRSLKVGKKRESYMAEHPELVEVVEERSKARRIHELERKIKFLELRILYLQKLKALVR